jgi:hypothetical protein
VDEKKGLQDEPQAQDADETEDTEGNIYLPRPAKPTDGGENPTGSDEGGAEGGENFHPRPFHPRP